MLTLRMLNAHDLGALMDMSRIVGSEMTTMPADEAKLNSRIDICAKTVAGKCGKVDEGAFFMVAEDSETKRIVGTTAIYLGIGLTNSFYTNKVSRHTKYCSELNREINSDTLNFVSDYAGCAEIGSLYLLPEFLRDKEGRGDLMPHHSVYTKLLPDSAQNVIAKPHSGSLAAKALLEREGFIYDRSVDVFDAGPTLAHRVDQIYSLRNRAEYHVVVKDKVNLSDQRYIISNQNLENLRIILCHAELINDNEIAISENDANNLEISHGKKVSLLALRERSKSKTTSALVSTSNSSAKSNMDIMTTNSNIIPKTDPEIRAN